MYTVHVDLQHKNHFLSVMYSKHTLIRLLSWPLTLDPSFVDLSVETALFTLERDASSSEITLKVREKHFR